MTFVFFVFRRPICQASELERKIKLCKDVPSLARRLGQGGGMMEMVAGEMMGENSDGPVRRKSCVCSAVRWHGIRKQVQWREGLIHKEALRPNTA